MTDEEAYQAILQMRVENRKDMNAPSVVAPVEFISLADITPKKLDWLIHGLFPKGAITILAGQAGIGKTNIALWFASLASNTGTQFNGKPVAGGKVLIWSGEDSAEHTIAPRLIAYGANIDNVTIIGDKTMMPDGKLEVFDISSDIYAIEQSIRARCRDPQEYCLLIIDPIISVVAGDMNQANTVRRYMQPLKELAERLNVAVVGITHFAKGGGKSDPQERVIGSQAFSALARMTLGLIRDEQTNHRRLIVLKTNVTRDDVGFEFSLEYSSDDGVPSIEFLGELHGSAKDLIAEIEPEESDGSVLSDAVEFLKGILHDGAVYQTQVRADSDGAGYSWRTICRASAKLKVDKRKDSGVGGKWRWSLPT